MKSEICAVIKYLELGRLGVYSILSVGVSCAPFSEINCGVVLTPSKEYFYSFQKVVFLSTRRYGSNWTLPNVNLLLYGVQDFGEELF